MGVGPARYGLRPGLGKLPGHNPAYDGSGPRRTLQYPTTGATAYPGRKLYIYTNVRRAIYPSGSLYPGTGLYTGGARELVRTTLLGAASTFLTTWKRGRKRTTLMEGAGRLLSIDLASSVPRTTMSGVVELANVDLVVDLATVDGVVELELVDLVVEL